MGRIDKSPRHGVDQVGVIHGGHLEGAGSGPGVVVLPSWRLNPEKAIFQLICRSDAGYAEPR
jgi:hypothetical protein